MRQTLTSRTALCVSIAALALSGCGGDPLVDEAGEASGAGEPITVGSAGFAESEIIAEAYAQALEGAGFTVERRMQIGARDAYIKALQDGSIDMVPEYSGNLLQFFDSESEANQPDEILSAISKALPQGMRILEASEAEDKDSYCVTAEFSAETGITSLTDLASYEGTLRLAGNPELAERPYGPQGLAEVYGVEEIDFTPIEDSGGPLTVDALVSGDVDLADIYTTTPAIKNNNLVVLEDPELLIVPQNVLPLLTDRVPAEAEEALNEVSEALTTEALIDMNTRSSGDEKADAATIAADWLAEQGIN